MVEKFWPFKNRLNALNLLTAALALSIAAVVLILHEYFMLRSDLSEDLGALAQVIADNSAASLAFTDAATAAQTLGTLRAKPEVIAAAVYGRDGRRLAQYRSGASAMPEQVVPGPEAVVYALGRVEVSRIVMLERERVGSVLIRARLGELYVRLLRYGIASLVAVLAALGTAFLLLSRMRRRLTHAEEEVHRINRSLEQRVAQRTAELERANRELEAFSYSVSHDLRAPLRAINGFSQILLETEREGMSDEGRHLLDRVAHNSTRMGELIDDILEYSRAGRAPIERTAVDLDGLARAVAHELAEGYPGATVEVAALPVVSGDRTMLREVLQNLIGNALKYSSGSPQPRVELGVLERAGERVFFVRDNGAGFDMQYAGKLFGMFQRMHSDSRFPGTGVGLAIVKRLVERHGGRVWAQAEPGKGATFFFTLGSGPGAPPL